jgi:protein-disulfide isomerase
MPKRKIPSKQNQRAKSNTRVVALGLAGLLVVLAVGALLAWPKSDRKSAPANLDKSKGAANAPVTVVEYGDFQCPACQRFFSDTERRLKEEYVNKEQVRFVFRNFAFIGNESRWAAEASECANEQGRFWDYHDRLYEKQGGENVGTFSKENLKRFAADLGLNAAQFNQCLDSDKYTAKVQQELAQGRQEGVRGTPTVFVNGRLIEGGADYRLLRSAIETALGKQ